MRFAIGSSLLGAALAAAVVLAPQEARAFGFTPAMCSVCPTTTELPFRYAIGDQFGLQGDLPVKAQFAGSWYMCTPGAYDCGQYLNNTSYTTYVAGNQNIKQFGFATYAFDLEWNYDHLLYGHEYMDWSLGVPFLNAVTTGSVDGWSGSIWWRDIPLLNTLQDDHAFMRFTSDISVTSSGVAVDRARVCCQAPSQPASPGFLATRVRTSGLLLATDDVVHFVAYSPSGEHQTVSLWPGSVAAGADFDLYARCNAMPTTSAFDARGFSSAPMENLHLDGAACPNGTWFITVHAFNGSGQFFLVRQEHYPSAHITLEVAFSSAPTDAQITSWEDYLGRSARYYFGATEGGRIVDRFYVHRNSTSCPPFDPLACSNGYCNLCIDPNNSGRASTYMTWPEHIQLYANDLGNPGTLPHELGHYDLGLPDEYTDVNDALGNFSRPQCGHTMMGLGFSGRQYNLCQPGDHTRDRMYNDPAGGDSAWVRIGNSQVPGYVSETPDNYPYTDFTFGGMSVGGIVEVIN